MPHRVLIADKVATEGLDLFKARGIEFDEKFGLKEADLVAVAGDYDAIVCRSGIKVTKPVLEAAGKAGKLKAIARAGVGVDNIDLEAATSNGVLVLNTAEASTLSTAEHALALMMALARKIPAADAHVRSGQWKRNNYQGTQLAGKTLGVVGLGRIGRTVATRALAMEMNVIGFDPFFPNPTALDGKVTLVRDFDEFLSKIDVITFHVPGGADTKHLLNRERLFNKCKPNLLVVNDARGEVLDEIALAEALKAKKIAGAAVDVYATEPPQKDHPLFGCENAVLTPHLGASTDEAQQAVAVAACEAIALFLSKGEIRGAVNAGGLKLDLPDDEACLATLAQRIGALLAGYHGDESFKTITVRMSGPKAKKLLPTLVKLAAVELLSPRMTKGSVNLINVETIAKQRGIDLLQIEEPTPPQGMVGDIVGVRVASADNGDKPGETHRILGTCYADRVPRVLRIDNYAMDMIPEGTMVLVENKDRPGVIGYLGNTFGDAGVNIADMVITRQKQDDGKFHALMVVKTDDEPAAEVLEKLRARDNILRVRVVKLPAR
ncbi:MAG: phosphoglycerate dehydrogenase [Tepidisphaeraceae bacterium]